MTLIWILLAVIAILAAALFYLAYWISQFFWALIRGFSR